MRMMNKEEGDIVYSIFPLDTPADALRATIRGAKPLPEPLIRDVRQRVDVSLK